MESGIILAEAPEDRSFSLCLRSFSPQISVIGPAYHVITLKEYSSELLSTNSTHHQGEWMGDESAISRVLGPTLVFAELL